VGCKEDFDCGDNRTCDPTANDNTGMCSGVTLSAKVMQVDIDNYSVRDAIPSSTGDTIYFIGAPPTSAYGIFKVDIDDKGVAKGPPSPLCPNLPFPPDKILINNDDTILFIGSLSPNPGIWSLAPKTPCNNPTPVPWTQGHKSSSIDIYEKSSVDTIYSVELDTQNLPYIVKMYSGATGAVNPSMTIVENADWEPADLAVGASRIFVLNGAGQLGVVEGNEPIVKFKTNLGLDNSGGVALSYTEDIVYVSGADHSQYHIVAINAAEPSHMQQYSMDAGWGDGLLSGGGSLNRARKANIFSWTTRDGKLYRFEPN
jgi:hypothetical protein